MNWYKQSQIEMLDSSEFQNRGKSYTDFGHDIDYEEENRIRGMENPNYKDKEPNLMWVNNHGNIEVKPETVDTPSHRADGAWGMSRELDSMYTGRYSPSEKVITVIPPHTGVGQFRGIPQFLQNSLQHKFPKAERMILY